MTNLSYFTYLKKVLGCFQGKSIGGTLGMPFEGFVGTVNVDYYTPVPTEMMANDDIDLQVIWLETIKRFGLPINRFDIGNDFRTKLLWAADEYHVTIRNMKNGIMPPLSGKYDNKFYGGMGSAIRTEIWACLAPGDPALAAKLAREDACVDHCDDGVDSAVFIAAIESAAFVESDARKLVEIGLSMINPDGRVYKMVKRTIELVDKGIDNMEIRDIILTEFFHQNWTDTATNLSFIVAAFLNCGGDNNKGICDVVAFGHDADCTAATLGSILGIIDPDGYDDRWLEPIGDKLVLSGSIGGMHEADTITEFCNQLVEICPQILDYYKSNVKITDFPFKPEETFRLKVRAVSDKHSMLTKDYCQQESLIAVTPLMVKVFYPEKVALAAGETGKFTAKFSNPMEEAISAKINLAVPNGWSIYPTDFDLDIPYGEEAEIEFSVTAPSHSKRRVAKNFLDFNINLNGLSYSISAGLIQTIDFLNIPAINVGDEAPSKEMFKNAELIPAYTHFFNVNEGEQLYTAEFKVPVFMPEVIMIAQGTRAIKVWIDDKLILKHDGCEYVPCFHRVENVARFPLDGEWHRLTIWTDSKDYDGTKPEVNPHNAIVPNFDGSMPMREFRAKYDKSLGEQKQGEVFIGFGERTGYMWIDNMEWRLPQI